MAAPTLAAFTERSGDLAFIYWGGTSTSGTLLGQVLDFSYTTTKGKKESYRLGDSARRRCGRVGDARIGDDRR